jgi:hypothetical protein
MAGAAAVAATVFAAAELGVPVSVTGYLCLAENMPSGTAQRPGDVVVMRDGTTVEIIDTDAEGRMVLGDGLCLASESKPDAIVDIATLTGAQMVALGARVAVADVAGVHDLLVIERAVVVCDANVVHAHHLPPTLQTAEASDTGLKLTLRDMLEAVEKDALQDALKSARGNRAKAARLLATTERIFNYKVRKYGLDWRRFRS